MRKILLSAAIAGLAVALFTSGIPSGTQDQPECTVTVRPGESIQAAIDRVPEGAVICLEEGTWEENIVIGKGLTLRGAGAEKSVIKGKEAGKPVIRIESEEEIEVVIAGLTAAEAKGGDGILVGGRACVTITGSNFVGNEYGIWLVGSAQATISGSNFEGNVGDGIKISGSPQATISSSNFEGNLWDGIRLGDSAQATIEGSKIINNEGYGVALWQQPCFDADWLFEGAVRGRSNEISGNKEADVCPSELSFLMTEEGGCYGPLCPAPLEEQPTKGSLEAPVTMVEFAEFYCPYCARYFWEIFPKIEEEYITQSLVKYQFLNLIVHGPVATLAAVAGECAHEQGRFWQFHDQLFEAIFPGRNLYQRRELDAEGLKGVAAQVGLDMERFSACIESYDADYSSCLASYNECTGAGGDLERCAEEFDRCLSSNSMFAKIVADREELDRLVAQLPPEEQAQAQRIGTPTFFINGHILIGAQPFERFRQMIERELARENEEVVEH
ncbi:MAG: thioredoxin domain-containing protein [Candidatus Acetothermia bacterium]|nr:thioredoxin domain-containing protein [Candidatus Acetothermia bacterium]MDH7504979.1 thioredoxin domain-containing protein [Candidatus Acetothermia bacterium]